MKNYLRKSKYRCIFVLSKSNDMKTQGLKIKAETEKAIQFEVGFKYDGLAPDTVFGREGEEDCKPGYPVYAWVPKSVIVDGEIASWFVVKNINKLFNRINDIRY